MWRKRYNIREEKGKKIATKNKNVANLNDPRT